MSYKVSILVPVYGVEQYIERCARSLFEQDYENLEYIFIDDCTPDHSIELLEKHCVIIPKGRRKFGLSGMKGVVALGRPGILR